MELLAAVLRTTSADTGGAEAAGCPSGVVVCQSLGL